MIGIKCFAALLLLFAASCTEFTLKFIATASYPNLREERLGRSSYYVKIPSTMFIEEARGKEGQLGYGIWLIDSAKRDLSPNGFIEIEHGSPIGWAPDCEISTEMVRSNLLDGTVKWTICKNQTGSYFSAIAYQGGLILSADSPTRAGLDSMIATIATLRSQP